MADYERINFRQEWYQEVQQFLEDNPELGFDSKDVKYFIKFCVKKQMNQNLSDDEKIEKILKAINKKN